MFYSKFRTKCFIRIQHKFFSFYQFQKDISPYNVKLFNHKIYGQSDEIREIKIFMESHIFALWDYLYMLKALKGQLASKGINLVELDVPSLPFLINQIIQGEEIQEEESKVKAIKQKVEKDKKALVMSMIKESEELEQLALKKVKFLILKISLDLIRFY